MTDATPVRPAYVDGQFLSAADFTAEQQYHLAMLRRHHVAHHTSGTVAGLNIGVDPGGNPFVSPGVGIDTFGRELVVTTSLPVPSLPGGLFPPGGPDAYDVVLLYQRIADTNGDVTRWIEQPGIHLIEPTTPGSGPPPVSDAEASFSAADEAPDDPAVQAPLFVGQLRRPDRDGDPPIIDQSGQPYVGLVASAINTPEGTARLELGGAAGPLALYAAPPRAPAREAAARSAPAGGVTTASASAGGVTTASASAGGAAGGSTPAGGAAAGNPPAGGATTASTPAAAAGDPATGSDPLVRRLTLDNSGQLLADGALDVTGALTVGSQLTLTPGQVQDGWGLQLVSDPQQSLSELRIQMGSPSDSRPRRTVIGCWGQSGSFTPLLEVADDGTVTIHGDLIVTGSVQAAGGVAPAGLSDQASQFATAALASGIGAAGGLVNQVLSGAFAPQVALQSVAVRTTAAQAAAHIQQNPAHAQTFVQELERAGEAVIRPLRDALHRL